MTDLSDVKALIEQQGDEWSRFMTETEAKFADIAKRTRPGSALSGDGAPDFTPEERKHFTGAFRALIGGDQATADRHFAEVKAMQVGIDSAGGYLVHPQLSTTMTRTMLEYAPVLGLARVINLTQGDRFEEPVDLESAAATWVGELETRADTATPALGMLAVDLHEIYALPKVSQKLIDCADIDVIGWLTAKIAEAFAASQADKVFNGSGVKVPRGLLTFTTAATSDASRSWGTFEHVATGASADFHTTKADPLFDLIAALKPRYRRNAKWFMSRRTAAKVRKLKEATSDQYLWAPGLQAGQPDRLLGFPIEYCEEMPELGAGSLSMALGDFEQTYTVVRRPGIKLLSDPYTDKPNVKLFAYERMGGGVANFESMKFLKFAAS